MIATETISLTKARSILFVEILSSLASSDADLEPQLPFDCVDGYLAAAAAD